VRWAGVVWLSTLAACSGSQQAVPDGGLLPPSCGDHYIRARLHFPGQPAEEYCAPLQDARITVYWEVSRPTTTDCRIVGAAGRIDPVSRPRGGRLQISAGANGDWFRRLGPISEYPGGGIDTYGGTECPEPACAFNRSGAPYCELATTRTGNAEGDTVALELTAPCTFVWGGDLSWPNVPTLDALELRGPLHSVTLVNSDPTAVPAIQCTLGP